VSFANPDDTDSGDSWNDFDDEEICSGCGDGDRVPAKGYWRCPICDAEWTDGEEANTTTGDE